MIASPLDREDGATTPAEGRASVLVLDKAIGLLDVIADSPEGMSLAELARVSGMHRSTAYRILCTLESHRFVMRNEHLKYKLGFALFAMGSKVKRQDVTFHAAASKHMREAAERTQLTSFLSIRDGDQARCLERVDRGEVWIATYTLGSTLPLTVGAGPMALLAHCSDDEIDRILTMPRSRLTPITEDDPNKIWQSIREIRRTGVAFSDQDVSLGIATIGAAVLDGDGNALAGVALSGLSQHVLGDRKAAITHEVEILAQRIRRDVMA